MKSIAGKDGLTMKALLIPNPDKPNATECTRTVARVLADCGITSQLSDKYSALFADCPEAECLPFEDALAGADVLIAIGGDGTILHAAKHAVEADKPLLGVNVGRLGFMASLEPSELKLLQRLRTREYTVEQRMLLHCTHYSGKETGEYLALNDVVVSNGKLSRMVDLDVSCNGKPVMSYRADGVLFSTPTGSTAYTLSAGGPIVHPAMHSILLTPVCPHSLFSRTLIFPADCVLEVRPGSLNEEMSTYLSVDGGLGAPVCQEDRVEIKQSECFLKLISFKGDGFYETLRRKFEL